MLVPPEPDGEPADEVESSSAAPDSARTLHLVSTAEAIPPDGDVVVLDTTWTPPGRVGQDAARVHSVRDAAERVLANIDLIAETTGLLETWAAGSGVIERLTIRGTSFWYYVRLRHWAWLEERILWARIVDALLTDSRPARITVEQDVEPALLDVLRLHAGCRGIELLEPPQEPVVPAGPPPETVPPPEPPRGVRATWLGRAAISLRNRLRGPSPPARRKMASAVRIATIRERAAALADEPERRLLVVQEHARQRAETPSG